MHPDIARLHAIAAKDTRTIIGLMSGTSLDGLDIALCEVTGVGLDTRATLKAFHTEPYDAVYRSHVRAVFSKRDVDLEHVCVLNPWIARRHAQMILEALSRWGVDPASVDLVASHGQTIYHAPAAQHGRPDFPNATLQLGDGDHMAEALGVITLSDFRQKQIAAGGEGAPLAAYGDALIFAAPDEDRVLLNIGGIANMTFLPHTDGAAGAFSSDIGPGNTMMDAYVQAHFAPLTYDDGSAIARSGAVNAPLLDALCDHAFFNQPFPKTTGPEVFNLDYLSAAQDRAGANGLGKPDVVATLSAFSARTIAQAVQRAPSNGAAPAVYVSGGGFHNPLLIERIGAELGGADLRSTEQIGVDPDAKEAVLFAVLANECVAGSGTAGPLVPGMPAIAMGKISLPR